MFVSQIFDEAAEILGTTDKTKVFRKLTQSIQTLMESGHWTHSTAEVDICTGWDRCTVTLPRGIETPLAVNTDGSPLYFRNRLFQYHVNKGGMYSSVPWAWDDRGFVATMMDIIQPSQLIAIAEVSNDAGKQLRVLGTDQYNATLRSQTPDGQGVDGLYVPIYSPEDFPLGTILPPDVTVRTRDAAISPLGLFQTATPHTLDSGQSVIISPIGGVVPPPLKDGQIYYVGVVSPTLVQLYEDPLNAQAGNYPINLQSIVGVSSLRLLDKKPSRVVTALSLSATPAIALDTANPINFPGNILPSPLKSKVTYFANLITPTNLQIFDSIADATNNTNPIYTTGSTSAINVDLQKPIAPQTKMTFAVPHGFTTGDQVQATTNGGILPQPLVAGTNYYVRAVNSTTVTIHPTSSDALNDTNPINLITSGSGTNSLVKLIPATVAIGTQSNILAEGVSLPNPSGSGAQAKGVPSGIITGVNVTAPGSGYTSAPTVTVDDTGGAGYVQNQVGIEIDSTFTTQATFNITVTGGRVASIGVVSPGSGYQPNATVTITDLSIAKAGKGAKATINGLDINGGITGITLQAVGSGAIISATINNTSNVVNGLIINSPGEGYVIPPRLTFTGGGGSNAAGTCSITTSFLDYIEVTNGGSNYTQAPAVTISGGGGTGATATATVSNGQLVRVNVVTKGTGYTGSPTITFTPSTGVFVSFTTTGTFPSPITQGASYRAEQPFSSSSFTITNVDYSPVNITSVGTGQFYVLISRAFAVGFTNRWVGDFDGLTTGQGIYFASDYNLPSTTPAIDKGTTQFFLNIDAGNETARIYNSQPAANAGGSTGLINVTAFGTGQAYYALRVSATPSPFENRINPNSVQFLQDGEIVRFSTSGTLPAPLQAATNYTIKIFGDDIKVYSNNNLVTITTPGTGQLSLDLDRTVTAVPSTKIVESASLYSTGQAITVRPRDGDSLPNPLVAGANYYVRKLDSDEFELYQTEAQARNLASTVGRISYQTAGNTADSTFIIDSIQPPTLVKSVQQIEKPKTDGFVSLYAYDYGRSNDMTLIGQYHPADVNPQYRRIRLGSPCAWARVIYRIKHPTIESLYDFIPLENERAILAALHAVDLEDKDFAEQAQRYWTIAIAYLKNQQESIDGHAMATPQINNIVYGDGSDVIMR
jgi:hypothetical protein